MKIIAVQSLHDHLESIDSTKELIIDVRTPAEYIEGHIPGAVNRPLDKLDQHKHELNQYETVYIHCRSGGRSAQACTRLEADGITHAVNVEGGAAAWEAAGYSLEK